MGRSTQPQVNDCKYIKVLVISYNCNNSSTRDLVPGLEGKYKIFAFVVSTSLSLSHIPHLLFCIQHVALSKQKLCGHSVVPLVLFGNYRILDPLSPFSSILLYSCSAMQWYFGNCCQGNILIIIEGKLRYGLPLPVLPTKNVLWVFYHGKASYMVL